jgi:PhoPQ-activated pathogenicity-related protein
MRNHNCRWMVALSRVSVVCWAVAPAIAAGADGVPKAAAASRTEASGGSAKSAEVPAALTDYVSKPDASFRWKAQRKTDAGSVFLHELELVSQTWHGIEWRHDLWVFEPKTPAHPRHVLLFVTGGANGRRPRQDSVLIGTRLALRSGARVAMLHQVPNQPLFGGRREDDLISETWLRYLESGDPTWPALFPMVKSAVRAMDAVEAWVQRESGGTIEGFVVTGASKRGWTTWLSAAADRRVIAIAPMVIDVLNFRPQMKYQLESWGRYSEQIADYTHKGLVKDGEETPREALLRRMVDPYTYRELLLQPKLILHGTNDPYWTVDAMKFYWDDLAGPKYTLAIPNAGHGLEGGRELVLDTIGVFFRHVAGGTPLPKLDWNVEEAGKSLTLSLRSSQPAKNAQLWSARSNDCDFRKAKWTAQPLREEAGSLIGRLEKTPQGHVALFGQLTFDCSGIPYAMSTIVWRK